MFLSYIIMNETMIPYFIRLTKKMAEKISEKAEERGVPRASIIKDILFEGLKDGK